MNFPLDWELPASLMFLAIVKVAFRSCICMSSFFFFFPSLCPYHKWLVAIAG